MLNLNELTFFLNKTLIIIYPKLALFQNQNKID